MKKIITMLIALTLCISLVGCGKEPVSSEPVKDSSGSIAEAPEVTGGAQMVNPWTDVDEEGFKEKFGLYPHTPEGATDVSYRVSDEVAEINFKLDGVDYCFRLQKGEEAKDISGMYYDGDCIQVIPSKVGVDVSYKEFINAVGGVAYWNWSGMIFCVSLLVPETMDVPSTYVLDHLKSVQDEYTMAYNAVYNK